MYSQSRVFVENEMPMDVQPFRVQVEEVLHDLHTRLSQTRWPDEIQGAGWDYGIQQSYMQELVEYWRTDFNWRAQEQKSMRLLTIARRLIIWVSILFMSMCMDLTRCHYSSHRAG